MKYKDKARAIVDVSLNPPLFLAFSTGMSSKQCKRDFMLGRFSKWEDAYKEGYRCVRVEVSYEVKG